MGDYKTLCCLKSSVTFVRAGDSNNVSHSIDSVNVPTNSSNVSCSSNSANVPTFFNASHSSISVSVRSSSDKGNISMGHHMGVAQINLSHLGQMCSASQTDKIEERGEKSILF